MTVYDTELTLLYKIVRHPLSVWYPTYTSCYPAVQHGLILKTNLLSQWIPFFCLLMTAYFTSVLFCYTLVKFFFLLNEKNVLFQNTWKLVHASQSVVPNSRNFITQKLIYIQYLKSCSQPRITLYMVRSRVIRPVQTKTFISFITFRTWQH